MGTFAFEIPRFARDDNRRCLQALARPPVTLNAVKGLKRHRAYSLVGAQSAVLFETPCIRQLADYKE